MRIGAGAYSAMDSARQRYRYLKRYHYGWDTGEVLAADEILKHKALLRLGTKRQRRAAMAKALRQGGIHPSKQLVEVLRFSEEHENFGPLALYKVFREADQEWPEITVARMRRLIELYYSQLQKLSG